MTDASIEAAATEDSDRTLPNRRGMSAEDTWAARASAYYQPSDHALVQLGGVAYPDEADGKRLDAEPRVANTRSWTWASAIIGGRR